MAQGKKFAADFERIDEVKGNDKILIQDSNTGVVKYASPSQINAKFDKLVADIETAVQAVADARAAQAAAEAAIPLAQAEVANAHAEAVAAGTAKSGAESAKAGAETAKSGAETAKSGAEAAYQNTLNALTSVLEDIKALKALIDNGGHHKAISYDAEEGFSVCGKRFVLHGHGVPSADTIPDQFGIPAFVGQMYINEDAASAGLYYAKGTSAVSDWKNANS